MKPKIAEPVSALFMVGEKESLKPRSPVPDVRVNFYRIEDVVAVSGKCPDGLFAGSSLCRMESGIRDSAAIEALLAGLPPGLKFRGTTQHLYYTDAARRDDLNARSLGEMKASPDTAAVLIPVKKSDAWWQMAQDQRQSFFKRRAQTKGHTAIGLEYAGRVFRRLYHCRYLQPVQPYDFLTYFEFPKSGRKDFQDLLNTLRDRAKNPEWAYVKLEFEIWMTKLS